MHKIKTLIMIAILMIWVAGCSMVQINNPSICEQIPEGETSIICEASNKLGIPIEETARLLKLANAGIIIADKVNAKEVLSFIMETKQILHYLTDEGLTLEDVLSYTAWEYGMLTSESQVLISIVNPFAGVEFEGIKYLSDFDIYLLQCHLDEQAEMVRSLMVFGE